MVTISPHKISYLSSMILRAGSSAVALHELVDIILWMFTSRFCSFTPKMIFISASELGCVRNIALTGRFFRRLISSFTPLASIIISIFDKSISFKFLWFNTLILLFEFSIKLFYITLNLSEIFPYVESWFIE